MSGNSSDCNVRLLGCHVLSFAVIQKSEEVIGNVAIYFVYGIPGFVAKEKIRHHVQLCDTATHKVFYDKLEYIYVEISKFNKTLEELDTLYEKWLYALKNLYKLTQRPKELCDKVFDRLFEEAEIAKFTPQELREYEASKIAYRDIKNSVDTAKREGIAEGMEKGMKKGMEKKSLEIAKKMLTKGMDEATVMEITGLTAELIQQLSKSQG